MALGKIDFFFLITIIYVFFFLKCSNSIPVPFIENGAFLVLYFCIALDCAI